MEYERIHKPETGMLSPSKLRMKLLGAMNQRKKDEEAIIKSSRTSPSKLHDSEFINNSLLAPQDEDNDQASGLEEASSMNLSGLTGSFTSEGDHQTNNSLSNDAGDEGKVKIPHSKPEGSNSSGVYPLRAQDEDILDYDSNASSSSFEFPKGEPNKSIRNHIGRSFQRQMPSKWNDAEKWIMNRHSQVNSSKKSASEQSHPGKLLTTNMVRVAPVQEGINYDNKLLVNRITDAKRAGFSLPFSSQANGVNASSHVTPQSNDSYEADHQSAGTSMIRSVSMRDTGTEMTPIASQEPSQTTTPIGSTTPLRSPAPSVPSTPIRGGLDSIPAEPQSTQASNQNSSGQDLKVETRREIVALGVQLGKMNIAAWASRDEKEKSNVVANIVDNRELDRVECERRAIAWEEAEKSKHTARYKREEIQIQAWESRQKASLAAELRRIEAKVEQIRAQAQAKMVNKISMARQQSEEKRAALGAKKNEEDEKMAAKLEYIRQTGKMPAHRFICCGWPR